MRQCIAHIEVEVLIEKLPSLQEFTAEEREHNAVIKKDMLCDMQGFISGLSHTDWYELK